MVQKSHQGDQGVPKVVLVMVLKLVLASVKQVPVQKKEQEPVQKEEQEPVQKEQGAERVSQEVESVLVVRKRRTLNSVDLHRGWAD